MFSVVSFVIHRQPCYKPLRDTWSRLLLTRFPVFPVQPWSPLWWIHVLGLATYVLLEVVLKCLTSHYVIVIFAANSLCVQHMVKMSYDVVKRWVNEAQEAASSDNIMVQVERTLHTKTSCCCVCVGQRRQVLHFRQKRTEAQSKHVDKVCALWRCDLLPECWFFWRPFFQYHALGLLYHLRKNDRLAVTKMLNKFTKSGLKSPFAYCMLIRIASKLLDETEAGWADLQHSDDTPGTCGPEHVGECVVFCLCAISHDSPLFDFIESCLRNKNEMVVYEAASAIVHMPNCTARELAPAVSGQNTHAGITSINLLFLLMFQFYSECVCCHAVLQLFCSSPKAALRYAAVRTLNKVALPNIDFFLMISHKWFYYFKLNCMQIVKNNPVIFITSTRWPWSTHQLWLRATWTWRTWSLTPTAVLPHWPSPLCSRRAVRAAWTDSWSRSLHSCPRSQMSSRSDHLACLVSTAFPYPPPVVLNVSMSVVLRSWWCRPSALFVRSIPGSTASWWTSCPTCSEMM